MGEDGKLIIGQCVGLMVGDKPVGFTKGGMLTPYYGQQWEVTCKVDNNVRQSEM